MLVSCILRGDEVTQVPELPGPTDSKLFTPTLQATVNYSVSVNSKTTLALTSSNERHKPRKEHLGN